MKIKKTKYIWLNNKFIPWDKAHVHILSHSLHFGTSALEGIRFYQAQQGTSVFRLKDHIKRLFLSSKEIGIKIPFSQKKVTKAVLDTIKINKIKSGYIRIIVFLGSEDSGLTTQNISINIAIIVWPWNAYLGNKAVSIKTSSFIKHHPKATKVNVKICGNYVNSILSSMEAKKLGYDEALLLDYQGNIAEGPGQNFFIISKNKLITPKPDNILKGITRDSVIEIAKDLNIVVIEKNITLKEAYQAEEAFFTGSATQIIPIKNIDTKLIGNKTNQLTQKIKKEYFNVVTGKNNKYKKWLNYVK